MLNRNLKKGKKERSERLVCSLDPHLPCGGMIPNPYCEDCEVGCTTEAMLKETASQQARGILLDPLWK